MDGFNYKIINENLQDSDKLCRIIEEAFSDFDINSINLLIKVQKNGDGYSYACYDGNLLIGFIMFLAFDNYIYLYRYAIDASIRGQGYGSKVLKDIISLFKKDNPKCVILLDVEYPHDKAKNNKQRKSRIKFYERLEFKLTDFVFDFHGDKYIYMVYKNNLETQDLENINKFIVPFENKYSF